MVRAPMASKHLTRNEFLKLTAGLASVAALPFTLGCPSDDTEDDGASTDDPSTSAGTTTTETSTSSGSTTQTPGSTTDEPGTSSSSGSPADSSSGTPEGTSSEGSSEGSTSEAGCTMDPDVVIGANHGHTLVVSLAEVQAGVEVVYNIQGGSMHPHSVTLTAEHFTMLQQGMAVMVDSSVDAMHSHQIMVTCG